jgi:hypothetical protein
MERFYDGLYRVLSASKMAPARQHESVEEGHENGSPRFVDVFTPGDSFKKFASRRERSGLVLTNTASVPFRNSPRSTSSRPICIAASPSPGISVGTGPPLSSDSRGAISSRSVVARMGACGRSANSWRAVPPPCVTASLLRRLPFPRLWLGRLPATPHVRSSPVQNLGDACPAAWVGSRSACQSSRAGGTAMASLHSDRCKGQSHLSRGNDFKSGVERVARKRPQATIERGEDALAAVR